jgi:hypothetical protein
VEKINKPLAINATPPFPNTISVYLGRLSRRRYIGGGPVEKIDKPLAINTTPPFPNTISVYLRLSSRRYINVGRGRGPVEKIDT